LLFVDFRDEQDPFYDQHLMDGKSAVTIPHSNALMSQDWEKDLMEAGTVKLHWKLKNSTKVLLKRNYVDLSIK